MQETNKQCVSTGFGSAGFEKPQDCKVNVQLKEEGGINVHLCSKLDHMFGKKMIQSAMETLQEMKVTHAEVKIWDFSSLDFTIKARVKSAVRRARTSPIEARLNEESR